MAVSFDTAAGYGVVRFHFLTLLPLKKKEGKEIEEEEKKEVNGLLCCVSIFEIINPDLSFALPRHSISIYCVEEKGGGLFSVLQNCRAKDMRIT